MKSTASKELAILKFSLPAVTFLLPLIFAPNLYLAFALPQVAFFRSAIAILTAVLLIFCIREKKIPAFKSFFRSSALIFLFFFFLVSVISTAFGDAPIKSFFGGYFRQQGLFTQLHYLAFVLLIITTFGFIKEEEKKPFLFRLVSAVSLSGSLVAFYGILQKIGIDPFFQNFDTAFLFGRIFATFGQPNLLGSWLLFTIAASLLLSLRGEQSGLWRIKFKHIGLIGIFLQITALILTLSRSAFLGFFVLITSFLILLFWRGAAEKRHLLKKWIIGSLVAAFFIIIVLVALQFAKGTEIAQNRFIGRFVLAGESLRSMESRIELWKNALFVFADSPFLGRGPETFDTAFPKYQSEKYLELEDYTGFADRAHNFILDLLVTVGLFGTIVFFLFLISTLYHTEKTAFTIPLIAGVCGFLTSDLLGFQMTAHSAFLYLFLALLLLHCPRTEIHFKKIASFSLLPALMGFFAVTLIATVYFLNIQPLRADSYFQKNLPRKAFELYTLEPLYALQAARTFLASENPEDFEKGIELAKTGLVISPRERDGYVLLGQFYAKLNNIRLSDRAFLEAVGLSPKSPVTIQPFADALYKQERLEEARAAYRYLLSISPKYWQFPLEDLGKKPPYEKQRYRIFFKDNPSFISILRHTADIEKKLSNFEEAKIYEEALKRLGYD